MPRRQKITEPGLAKQQIQSEIWGRKTTKSPATYWHEHANRSSSEDAILSSMNDAPVLKPFGLFREKGQGVSHIGM
jgi:gentisate 1,2-dioxygenase